MANCVQNGLLTQEEADTFIANDGCEDYILEDMKTRLFEKSVSKVGFGFAWEALYLQLVKQNS
ncbi:MAG: hypothetical protein JXA79_12400 [Deltaproteobacteria bacterium]|nr:hypothetical protein [Deltaproteobacteria bacterium]